MAFQVEKKMGTEFLYVAVFTTVTVMLWVGLEVVRALTTPANIAQVTKEELEPLSTELQIEVVNKLKARTQISQEILDKVEVVGEAVELPVTESTESASIKIESLEEEEATSSGGF